MIMRMNSRRDRCLSGDLARLSGGEKFIGMETGLEIKLLRSGNQVT